MKPVIEGLLFLVGEEGIDVKEEDSQLNEDNEDIQPSDD